MTDGPSRANSTAVPGHAMACRCRFYSHPCALLRCGYHRSSPPWTRQGCILCRFASSIHGLLQDDLANYHIEEKQSRKRTWRLAERTSSSDMHKGGAGLSKACPVHVLYTVLDSTVRYLTMNDFVQARLDGTTSFVD